ncbi:MAG: single-stranded-DNA-specific exonuclease RecJ [bacterium]|nr:single-stranded-DNA-specific exonuclease RecJ [bacterium]
MDFSFKGREWILKEADELTVSALARTLGIDPILGRLLCLRGVRTETEGRVFLQSRLDQLTNPSGIPGIREAADRIVAAIEGDERICVYGDYDCDGVTATSLLVLVLRQLGAQVSYFLPHRMKHGYGLHSEAIREISAAGTKLLITVDNGISAHEEIKLARSLGLEVIVTDHHEPPEALPETPFLVNPKVHRGTIFPEEAEEISQFSALSGVGLAFALMVAVRAAMRGKYGKSRVLPKLREYLDLVAIGTIGDVVPLVRSNRILVHHGLVEIGRSRNPGVRALMRAAGLTGSVVTPGHVGFQLAPRINAAGRMGDADLALRLLVSPDPREVEEVAGRLNAENARRQEVEQEILAEALEKIEVSGRDDRVIVLHADGWHPGVIGIVASRIVERFYRPTILISRKNGKGTGSARSIPKFSLYDALHSCSDALQGFGGHAMAAGLTISWDRIDEFRDAVNGYAAQVLKEDDLIPKTRFDAVLDSGNISEALVTGLERLKPFGMGNPEPLFLSPHVHVDACSVVGAKHLKFRFSTGRSSLKAIGFNMGECLERIDRGKPLDVLYQLRFNDYNGVRSIQAVLADLRYSV